MTASKKSEKKSTPKEGTGVKINNLLFKGLVEIGEELEDKIKKLKQVTERMGL